MKLTIDNHVHKFSRPGAMYPLECELCGLLKSTIDSYEEKQASLKTTHKISQSIVTDNTIMPDGRPYFAWRNELEMLRNAEPENNRARREIESQMKLLKIAEIESHQDPMTMDIVVRFRMIDQVNSKPDELKYVREK